ncbi:uncharacterized protein LOC142814608 isoform X1 [Rhipicephalus microplus]|uniref:uncharacterized protein LOC142814608 isoform X1 n=1 Tax=Rhipicephalus microplus TaxID=6941 RepID=UPI003F6CA496
MVFPATEEDGAKWEDAGQGHGRGALQRKEDATTQPPPAQPTRAPAAMHRGSPAATEGFLPRFLPLSSLPAEHGRPLDVRCILMVVRRAMEGRAATEQHREREEGTASLRSLPEASLDGGPVHLPLSYTARTGDAPSRTGGGPRGTFLGPIVISDERDSSTMRASFVRHYQSGDTSTMLPFTARRK